MRTTLLLSTCLLFASASTAALPPDSRAPLGTHLLEVNAQWKAQGSVPLATEQMMSFRNDAERIAMHLHLVSAQLGTHLPGGIGAAQLQNRLELLKRLDRYADRGQFPQNHVLSYRNPVFIDPHGTACAVGQLIIESGHRDLAERISAEMNLAYVLDMPASPLWPEIAAWADEHGFTAEELAWIQPAYSPNYPWAPLGGGTNGAVRVVKELANGDLLIGGDFTDAGGVAASHVALWDGASYTGLGSGLQGTINCAVEFDGMIYVGGAMLDGSSDLAAWNGTSWSYSTVFAGKYPVINALHVHNGALYAAGTASGFAGNTEFVQQLTGGSWLQVGATFDAPVLALASHNGALIAAGAFLHTNTPSLPPPVMHVATFTGADWEQLGDGLDATVRTLLDVDGTLYAGGDLYANIAPVFGMARIDASSSYWEQLLPNHADYIFAGAGPSWISSLVEHDGVVYFGGNFSIYLMMTYGTHIGRFGGTADDVQPLVFLDAPVNAVAMSGVQLVMGGDFATSLPHIATLDLTASVDDPARATGVLQVQPNPATDEVRVRSANGRVLSAPSLFDAAGKQLTVGFERKDDGYRASVSTLPTGVYVVHFVTNEGPVNARFVKE